MALVKLDSKEVAQLEELLVATRDARLMKRAHALLWLRGGDSITEVAARLRATRQTVYSWAARFEARADLPIESRIADGVRQGRPCTARGIIDPLIEQVVETDPRESGYRSTIWTAELLRHHLAEEHGLCVSTKSVGRALERLRFGWKRPRHTPARRALHWRQAKGG